MKQDFQVIYTPRNTLGVVPSFANLVEIVAPFDGSFDEFDIWSPVADGRPATFDVSINGNSIFEPGDRPTFTAGISHVNKPGLNQVILKGDRITVAQATAGNITRKIFFQFSLDDDGGGGGGAATLDDLTDVEIIEPAEFDVLVFDGENWTNGAVEAANGIPAGGDEGQILAKSSDDDFAVEWVAAPTSGAGGGTTGADSPPGAPNDESDEFDSLLLDSKWTKATAGTLTEEYNSRLKSWIALTLKSTDAEYSIIEPFTPGAVQWSVTAEIIGDPTANYHNIGLKVRNATDANYLEAMLLYNNGVRIEGNNKEFSTVTLMNTVGVSLFHTGKIYVHLQRIYNIYAESVMSVWWSNNGITWARFANQNFDFTAQEIQLQARSSGSSAQFRCGFNWIRRDWLFLAV